MQPEKEKRKFDYAKLKDLIISTKSDSNKYYNRTTFSAKIGISYYTLLIKLISDVSFTQGEIIKISELLNIKNEEIPKYFFELKIEKT